ncbi:hypothetical protein [Streptomyces sp. NPDC047841]|uniref:hypothetical protein n=1 Tax=Streptomyces sp. NPDC047841 TaxID=3154708 RepID=UPI003455B4CC
MYHHVTGKPERVPAAERRIVAHDAPRTPVRETFAVLVDCLTAAMTEAQRAG